MSKALEEAAQKLREANSVVVAAHVQPDGDAFGSLLAMLRYLKKSGKDACATWGEEIKIPTHYRWMPGILDIVEFGDCRPADVLLTLDCANERRLGLMQEMLPQFRTVINIDHHIDNSRFGAINVLDFSAGATCEIVYDLFQVMGAEIDSDIANLLYTGIVTDTGRFQYSNTTPKTLRIAANLIDHGAQPNIIFETIYESISFNTLKLMGKIIDRAAIVEESGLIYSFILEIDLKQAGSSMGDTETFIDYLRMAREASVAAILKETPSGPLKISLRSKGEIDVGAIAREGGGGGHRNAAGATLDMPIDDAVEWISARVVAQKAASAMG